MIKNYEPSISVIIPTLNNEQTIENCLKSIKKQTYRNVEIIVIDEFSKDKTPAFSKKYGICYQMRGERSAARNFGANKAKGIFLLFIDSDMELTENVVKDAVNICSFEEVVVIPERSTGSGFWTKCRILERNCYQGDDFIEAARFFPKEVFKSLKGYDTKMTGVEDWDLHQRAKKKGCRIKRIKAEIIHNEGKISLFRAMKKKMYYGRVFSKYKKRHPQAFKEAFIRKAFFKKFPMLIKDPLHFAGMIFLKTVEGVSLILGMLLLKTNNEN